MNHVSFGEVTRLVSMISSAAGRIRLSFAEAVDRLEAMLEDWAGASSNSPSELQATARALLRARARRPELLGVELFRDPAWDILLDLYANGGEEGMMVSALCQAAGVPPTTALRYVYKLVEAGNLVCEDHPQDQRRTMVRMAPHMPERMEQILTIMRSATA